MPIKLNFDITKHTASAIRFFWATKKVQKNRSVEQKNNRGSVVGGKQLDGFIKLLRKAAETVGIPSSSIYDRQNYIPGFFRSSKDWDFMILSPTGKLLVLIELKSQIGSYGNNFNNRAEEALGNATDLWTAYREKEFSTLGTPWVGYLMVIGYDSSSTSPVKNFTNHFPVLPEFDDASYLERYRILCEKMMTERLYTSTALIWTKDAKSFGDVSQNISIENFIRSLQGYLIGCLHEFES